MDFIAHHLHCIDLSTPYYFDLSDGFDATSCGGWWPSGSRHHAGSCKSFLREEYCIKRLIISSQPAFLRACHSPWRFIPQNILVILRGIIVTYLTAVAIMVAYYKLAVESDDNGDGDASTNMMKKYSDWRHIFDYAIITFALTFLYQVITFVSSHLESPDFHHGGLTLSQPAVLDLHASVLSERG